MNNTPYYAIRNPDKNILHCYDVVKGELESAQAKGNGIVTIPTRELSTVLQDINKSTIGDFIKKVEARAEQYMLKTHKLEGIHYAAMKEIAKELGIV